MSFRRILNVSQGPSQYHIQVHWLILDVLCSYILSFFFIEKTYFRFANIFYILLSPLIIGNSRGGRFYTRASASHLFVYLKAPTTTAYAECFHNFLMFGQVKMYWLLGFNWIMSNICFYDYFYCMKPFIVEVKVP